MQIANPIDHNEHYRDCGVRWFLSRRTADTHAGFFMRHLRSGMRLLDCGCGPGTITVGLAKAVEPGAAWGIDLAPVQIEAARVLVRENRVSNLQIEAGDVTALPFGNAEFDAVFASNVLQYLADPLDGLKEIGAPPHTLARA